MNQQPPGTPTDQVKLTFLLGAGASKGANVPTTYEFVTEFRKELVSKSSTRLPALDSLLKELSSGLEKRYSATQKIDVEQLLEAISILLRPSPVTASLYTPMKALSTDLRSSLVGLEADLRQFIRTRGIVNVDATAYLYPLLRLELHFGQLHIFSTNYDVVVEQFLSSQDIDYIDGFEFKWQPALFAPDDRIGVYLYKLHGSVIWFHSSRADYVKIPIKESDRPLTLLNGDTAEPVILFPGQKEITTGPFLKLHELFLDRLAETEILVVAGYSFRDDQLGNMITESFSRNPTMTMVLVGPGAERIFDERLSSWGRLGIMDPGFAL